MTISIKRVYNLYRSQTTKGNEMNAVDKLKGLIYVLEYARKDISSLRNVYADGRANLDGAEMLIADALTNLEGHLNDIKEGVE